MAINWAERVKPSQKAAEAYFRKQLNGRHDTVYEVLNAIGRENTLLKVNELTDDSLSIEAKFKTDLSLVPRINKHLEKLGFAVIEGISLIPDPRKIWTYRNNGTLVSVDFWPSDITQGRPTKIPAEYLAGKSFLRSELERFQISRLLTYEFLNHLGERCEDIEIINISPQGNTDISLRAVTSPKKSFIGALFHLFKSDMNLTWAEKPELYGQIPSGKFRMEDYSVVEVNFERQH